MKISTAKQYRPNWKNIFSQLQNYFFTIEYSLLANKYTEAFLSPVSGFVARSYNISVKPNQPNKD